jgi:hypothetical protein
MTTYYVSLAVDGDEIIIAHCSTYPQALERMRAERKRDPIADVSVWDSKGGMVAIYTTDGAIRERGAHGWRP